MSGRTFRVTYDYTLTWRGFILEIASRLQPHERHANGPTCFKLTHHGKLMRNDAKTLAKLRDFNLSKGNLLSLCKGTGVDETMLPDSTLHQGTSDEEDGEETSESESSAHEEPEDKGPDDGSKQPAMPGWQSYASTCQAYINAEVLAAAEAKASALQTSALRAELAEAVAPADSGHDGGSGSGDPPSADRLPLEVQWHQFLMDYLADEEFADRASRIMALNCRELRNFRVCVPSAVTEQTLSVWRHHLMDAPPPHDGIAFQQELLTIGTCYD